MNFIKILFVVVSTSLTFGLSKANTQTAITAEVNQFLDKLKTDKKLSEFIVEIKFAPNQSWEKFRIRYSNEGFFSQKYLNADKNFGFISFSDEFCGIWKNQHFFYEVIGNNDRTLFLFTPTSEEINGLAKNKQMRYLEVFNIFRTLGLSRYGIDALSVTNNMVKATNPHATNVPDPNFPDFMTSLFFENSKLSKAETRLLLNNKYMNGLHFAISYEYESQQSDMPNAFSVQQIANEKSNPYYSLRVLGGPTFNKSSDIQDKSFILPDISMFPKLTKMVITTNGQNYLKQEDNLISMDISDEVASNKLEEGKSLYNNNNIYRFITIFIIFLATFSLILFLSRKNIKQ